MAERNRILKQILPPFLLVIIIFIAWLGCLTIKFLNDDFQIIGWHHPVSLLSCLNPFITKDVSVFYWRPLVNTLHSLILWIFGFYPGAYHLSMLVLYILSSVSLMYFLRCLGFSVLTSLITSVFFGLLPSHELAVAWIAGQGDVLALLMILIAAMLFIKGMNKNSGLLLFLSAFTYLLAIITKEHAFAGAIIPFFYFIFIIKDKSNSRKYYLAILACVGLIAAILTYRYFLIGGTPFSSDLYSKATLGGLIKNLIIYIPASFLPPDWLENWYYKLIYLDIKIIIFTIIMLSAFIYFILNYFKTDERLKSLAGFGIAWFIVFIIPVLPSFMRWYVLLPSIGLIIFISAIIEHEIKNKKRPAALACIVMFSIIFIPSDIIIMSHWNAASKKQASITASLNDINFNNITMPVLWGAPNKYERVNEMKTGIEQYFEYVTKRKGLSVLSPLRAEYNQKSKFIINKIDSANFVFKIENGRYLYYLMPTSNVPAEEEFSTKNNHYSLKIRSYVSNGIQYSEAAVHLFYIPENSINLYFDGIIFKDLSHF